MDATDDLPSQINLACRKDLDTDTAKNKAGGPFSI